MNELEEKYHLLEKYGMHLRVDDMVLGYLTLEKFVEELKNKVKEDYVEEEFFEGVSFNCIDMLKGDISELTPIINKRVELYLKRNKTYTVMEVLQRFIKNEHQRKVIYREYFGIGGSQ